MSSSIVGSTTGLLTFFFTLSDLLWAWERLRSMLLRTGFLYELVIEVASLDRIGDVIDGVGVCLLREG